LAFRKGLTHLTSWFAHTLCATAPGFTDAPSISVSDAAAILEDGLRWYHRTGVIFVHHPICSPERKAAAEMITATALMFVHCHELAHVLLDHYKTAELRAVPEFTRVPLYACKPQAEAELAADRLAIGLLLGMDRQGVPLRISQAVAYGGAWLFLRLAELLEGIVGYYQGSHPPASDRLDLVREAAKAECQRRQLPPEWLFGVTGAISQAFRSIVPLCRRSQVVSGGASPLDEILTAALKKEEGLLDFQAQLATWLASSAMPDLLCSEIARIRAGVIREVLPTYPNVLAMSDLELADAADEGASFQIRLAMAKLLALNGRLGSERALPDPSGKQFEQAELSLEITRSIFGEYQERIDQRTKRLLKL
jgi:hypothetical protein